MNTLAVRYTEERYCTKQEVSQFLNGVMVDPIWQNILDYRCPFIVRFKIDKEVEFCLCQKICLRMLTLRQSCNQIRKSVALDLSSLEKWLYPTIKEEVLFMMFHWHNIQSDLPIMIHEAFVKMKGQNELCW